MIYCKPKRCFAGDTKDGIHYSFKKYKEYFFYNEDDKYHVFVGNRYNSKDIPVNYIPFSETEFKKKFNLFCFGD